MIFRATAILFCSLAMSLHAVEIIAHRGASHDAPENTLSAFRLGWEQGADAVELDIHLSKDGQIVAIHDATTKKNIGVDKAVAEQTLAELHTLDAGAWKGPQWASEKMPTLAEALAIIPAGKRIFIEIKCGPEVMPELVRVVRASGKTPAQLAIIAFDYEVAEQAKQRLPGLPVYLLAGFRKDKKTGALPALPALIAKAKAARLDGLDLDYKFPIDAAFVAKVKAAGLGFYVWTVNDPEVARRLVQAGVDGITTDRPAWLREQLE